MKKIALSVSFLIFILYSFSQPGWNWQNPLPQGNPLYSISFVRTCGWAVGPNGTAISTCDYGETWERVDLGTTENLNAVCMHDDNMIFIVGDNGSILFVMDHQSGEIEITKQNSNTTVNLNSVTTDINGCIWIAGDNGVVLRSNDLGLNWERQNMLYKYDLSSMHNIECTEAWAVGPDGFMMYTSDLGNSWKYVLTPTTFYLTSVHVGTFENIRVTGQQGLILHTSDKGQSWKTEHQENSYNLLDVINVGLNTAYAVGTDEKILETSDYGVTWTEPGIEPQLYTTTLYDVEDQFGQNQVWVTGDYGVILKNSGVETPFSLQTKGTLQWLHSIEFFDHHGWAVGGILTDFMEGSSKGIVLRTEDGGETWDEFHTLPVQLNDADFISNDRGWLVGRDGYIARVWNGGLSSLESPIGGFLSGVSFVDNEKGWIVSRDNWGEIIHTIDGGNSWTIQTNTSGNPLHDVFFVNNLKGWAVGLDSTIIRTVDGGQTWLRVAPYTVSATRYESVFFIDEKRGWVAGTGGVIVTTLDGGVSWEQVTSNTFESLESIFFSDQDNGWAVGDNGTILRSVDGGYSWFKQRSVVSPNTLSSVIFTDILNGWAVGEGGSIIHTSNGGFIHDKGTFVEHGLGLPINDNETTKSTIEVDVSEWNKSGQILNGLEVYIDTIFHSRVSDLKITLAHNGITDTLAYHVNDDGKNFLWTIFKDETIKTMNDGFAPFSGEYKPYQPLSNFNGTDPNGEWILHIHDNKLGETGFLYSWGIKPLFEKTTAIEDIKIGRKNSKIILAQNVPNPFSERTEISWENEISGLTQLKIFNGNGQVITTLVNQQMPAGKHFIEFNAENLSPGIYFYQIKIENYIQTRKLIIQED